MTIIEFKIIAVQIDEVCIYSKGQTVSLFLKRERKDNSEFFYLLYWPTEIYLRGLEIKVTSSCESGLLIYFYFMVL